MAGTGIQWMWFIAAGFGAFAVLGMLRVLACHCEHHLNAHRTICEVRRMRNEYLERLHERQQAEAED